MPKGENLGGQASKEVGRQTLCSDGRCKNHAPHKQGERGCYWSSWSKPEALAHPSGDTGEIVERKVVDWLLKRSNSPIPFERTNAFHQQRLLTEARELIAIAQPLIEQQAATIAELRGALESLAALGVPEKPQGNAGAYSIRHIDITRARATLERTKQP